MEYINQIIHGDSLDILNNIPDNSVDAIVTDPPYGIGFGYLKGKEQACTAEEYWTWFSSFYSLMLSKGKPGAFVAIWQAQMYFEHFWTWFGRNIHIYCAAKNFVN